MHALIASLQKYLNEAFPATRGHLPIKEQLAKIQELHGMQMAAISTAAMQNTGTSRAHRIDRGDYYWTPAYADVCAAVDREIDWREKLKVARAQNEQHDAMLINLFGPTLAAEKKFIDKVEAGQARSRETYADLKADHERLMKALAAAEAKIELHEARCA